MGIFNKVEKVKIPQNVFKDLTYSNKFDMQLGLLYPVEVEEIVPGDLFYAGHGAMVRSQPMVTPVMHNFNYNIRYFFVPNRIIWENFESFIADQEKGKKAVGLESPHVHPYLFSKDARLNMLHDMIGVSPLDGATGFGNLKTSMYFDSDIPINALPFRAYAMIWNEYFKDENTMDDFEFPLTDGADDTDYELLRVSWKKDYFTSALPFAQRGDEVEMIGNVFLRPEARGNQATKYQELTGTGFYAAYADNPSGAYLAMDKSRTDDNVHMVKTGGSEDYGKANIDPNDTLGVELSFAAIRRANALQKFLERSALGGNRYAELLLAHFGVRSSDQSLQRPQYLGGGVAPINISPVEQTSESGTTPQGTLAGKGVGIGSMYMSKPVMFTEHGWLLGIAYIRPDADYCQGLRRQLVKRDRFDYYWPSFQNIGEQEILNREIFASSHPSDNNGTFGYQSRYAEYKWHGNEIHGAFRKQLRSWVAPREFSSLPTLSKEFIECSLDISNNMAVSPDQFPPFMVEALNVVNARRPMYYFNRGGL